MKTGLYTLDANAKRSFQNKVALAVVYYRRKYGVMPNVVYVHPDAFFEYADEHVGGDMRVSEIRLNQTAERTDDEWTVTVRPLRTVLRHHFWTGIEAAE